MLTADLEGFFDTHPRSLVIDEAQRLPGDVRRLASCH
jgi:hypothetical protein